MRKFYFSSLARRPLTLSGHKITFLVSNISGGSAAGVYATDNPSEISVLDDAVRGRRGVSEITEEAYEESAKKTKTIPSSSNTNSTHPRLVRQRIQEPLAMEEKAGVARAAGEKPPKPSQDTLFQGETHTTPSIASLLRVKRLNPPKPFAESDAKTSKASKRADRAKVRVARGSVDTVK